MTRRQEEIDAVAVAVAVSTGLWSVARSTTRRAAAAVQPLERLVLQPPWLPPRLHPQAWLEALNREGEVQAAALRLELSRRLDDLVPAVVTELARRVDLTELVLRHVDVDAVVSAVDLDAAAARLDVAPVVERVEVDAFLERVDLDAVIDRVDLDAVIERVNVDAVIERVDLALVLDRLDLTAIVLERVDLGVLIQAVLDRVDLIGLADEIIEGVDLPQIIRESTGSMASETVQGARMQGIAADEAVSRVVDRLLLRRRNRDSEGGAVGPVALEPVERAPSERGAGENGAGEPQAADHGAGAPGSGAPAAGARRRPVPERRRRS